ncbi:MAG: class A beta-lactamase-related serine hydrolase [Planctomycetes bacterium]|nr:class A beta-lactamase-related serine hydrolase [Planctomycetota bacterium]
MVRQGPGRTARSSAPAAFGRGSHAHVPGNDSRSRGSEPGVDGGAAGRAAKEARRIEALLERYAACGELDGAVAVARRGELVYQGAFGLANRELGVPCTSATRFQIGSITKTFTALMVLRLVERGELALDGTLAEFLPDLPFPRADELTLERLLTHTAGLQRDIADYPPGTNQFPDRVAKINADFFSLEELVALIAARPLAHAPGEQFDYSSDGYGVLGLIVARVLETSYPGALEREILGPLGMKDTGYVPQTSILPNRATGYAQTFDGFEIARPLGISPAGGMVSTVGDLLKLERALLGDELLSARAKQRAWAPSEFITAYGWKVRPDPTAPTPGTLQINASGSLPGFYSLFTRTLGDGLCVVVLTNVHGPSFHLDALTDGVLAILRGREPVVPKRSAALDLAALLVAKGTAPALEAYRAWSAAGFPEHDVDEGELNALGYRWLASDAARAAAVFRLGLERSPESPNTHESLGEALEKLGEFEAARASCARAVELARSAQHPDLPAYAQHLATIERKLTAAKRPE